MKILYLKFAMVLIIIFFQIFDHFENVLFQKYFLHLFFFLIEFFKI